MVFQTLTILTSELGMFWQLMDYRTFYDLSVFNSAVFNDVTVHSLYLDFVTSLYLVYCNFFLAGTELATFTLQIR